MIELGLEEALGRHVSLIEWPERMGALIPQQHLMITITPVEHTGQRQLDFHAGRDWAERLSGSVFNLKCHWQGDLLSHLVV